MADYPSPDTPIKAIGFTEFCEVNGRQFKRKKGMQQWTEIAPGDNSMKIDASSDPLYLTLVHVKQAPGEPLHWALLVAREGRPGFVYHALAVKEVVEQEPPPRAENQAAVKENCQSWAVRVIAKLAERGIVEQTGGWMVWVISQFRENPGSLLLEKEPAAVLDKAA
ncbi:hypothetical protein AJ79_00629 [Helicocarpus griseus UAMH5409]|uniref:Uncharacterized protein n=1 Tax=Helicocarpus griseus UAMH5409 TaxID=1447875 RepID=A0A2B7YAS6_9EURO|nr:hypothetical protein AJ79_00629 [Helicocarpus griseus UAMH5409]